MAIEKQLRDVLTLIADLAQNDVNRDVPHILVMDRMELLGHETHKHIHDLESLGLVKIQPRMNQAIDEKGREYRPINITREGLQELSSD